jgi:D-serine deaminase-like pyridoxal phosphate-dependent protein
MPSQTLDDLDTPSLIVNMDIMERNLHRMADFAKECDVDLRPHVKTHKVPEIAKLQLAAGAKGVCLQKLSEAEVFATYGITDIFITNEVVGKQKYPKLARLADQTDLKVAIDNYENAVEISKACSDVGTELKVLVDIDVGMHRCGAQPVDAGTLAEKISRLKNLVFIGIMGYDGQAASGKTKAEREKISNDSMDQIAIAQKEIRKTGLEIKVTSVGSSVSTWIDAKRPEVTEVQPGMYLFNAVNLVQEEVATLDDCALTVLSTVMSRPAEDRAVLDAGSKAFHFDHCAYPWLVGLEGAEIYGFSEEHANVRLSGASRSLKLGDRVQAIPQHCCTCINSHDEMVAYRNGKVENVWKIAARGMMK